jgi:hypothetical protein
MLRSLAYAIIDIDNTWHVVFQSCWLGQDWLESAPLRRLLLASYACSDKGVGSAVQEQKIDCEVASTELHCRMFTFLWGSFSIPDRKGALEELQRRVHTGRARSKNFKEGCTV